jgi:hypothetical protein
MKAGITDLEDKSIARQRYAKHVSAVTNNDEATEELLEAAFCMRSIQRLYKENPCGGGVEYLHRDHASRRRRRKGKPRIWDSKIWPRILQDSDPKMTALARTSSNCKQQTRPLVREGAPDQQTRNCQTIIKIWSLAPNGCFVPRQTGRLTVGRNITLTLTLFWSVEDTRELQSWVSCRSRQTARTGAVEQGYWRPYNDGSRNLAKTSEELRRINVCYSEL